MEILIVILVDSYYFEVDLGCNLVSKMACFLFSDTINAGFNFLATLQSFYWPLIGEILRREVNLVMHPRIKGFCINNSPLLTSYNVFSMLRPVSSPTHASTIEGWVSSGDTSFTGWMPMAGFGSECVQVYKCLYNMAPGYLSTLCQPVSSVPGRRHLRSARRGELHGLSTCQSGYVRGTGVCLCRSHILELCTWQSQGH